MPDGVALVVCANAIAEQLSYFMGSKTKKPLLEAF
jgi:hypothetical protein